MGILLVLCLAWLGSHSDALGRAYSIKGEQTDYYSLLVHGLQKGHLYLDFPVDPRRMSSDPSVSRRAESLIDASLYNNRYYLYFGIVPAALLLLPYHLLTGSDLSGNTAVLLLVVAGLMVYWRVFEDARRRYFPGIPTVQYAASVVLLAMGSGAPMLLTYCGVYELAISAGYLCHALTWLFLFRALHSEGKEAHWLALASTAAGLAVGCRPNYLFVLPVVAIVAALLVRRGGPIRRMSTWAVLPAAVVGLGLAAYNYARFGSALEFGLSYQLDEMILSKFPMFRPSFFWSNLKWYFLRPPAFGSYFPYVFHMNAEDRPEGYYGYESIHGQLPVTLLALVTLAWLFRRTRGRPLEPGIKALIALLGLSFAILFLAVAFYGNRAERYTVDFQSSLILLIVISAGAAASLGAAGLRLRTCRLAFVVMALGAALSNVLASLQLNGRFEELHPSTWKTLSYWGDLPSAVLARTGITHFGPVRFRIVIPAPQGAVSVAPLLATGLPGQTDVLYLTQLQGNVIQLKVTHAGLGEVKSALVAAEPGTEHELEVDFGSLYPPRDFPLSRGSAEDREILKTTAVVRLDDKVVIERRVRFFDSPPGWVCFGGNPGGTDAPFRGKIIEKKLLPARTVAELGERYAEPGVCRLAITFPFEYPGAEEPVLGSGTPGHGNLLLLHTVEGHSVQFDLDQWGVELVHSPPIPVAGDGTHKLEIFIGGEVARSRLPAAWNLDPSEVLAAEPYLRIWLDGQPVWTTPVTLNRDTYQCISIGSNPERFSSGAAYYLGQIEPENLSEDEIRSLIESNIQVGAGVPGLYSYKVEFPADGNGPGLPLFGAGVAGDGNLLFARSTRAGTYRLGLDDWGLAATYGNEFPVQAGLHDLQFVIGPLISAHGPPPAWVSGADAQALKGWILVYIDHKLRGSFQVEHHLDQFSTVTLGANPQGFSTAAPKFLGPQFVPVPMSVEEARELVRTAVSSLRHP